MRKLLLHIVVFIVISCSQETNELEGNFYQRDGITYSVETDLPINGILKYRFENGNLQYSVSYKNGLKDGVIKGFYENGQLTYRRTYKEGKLDGLWELFHENGQVSYTGNYKNNKEVGVWRYFDENGELLSTGNSLSDSRRNWDMKKREVEEEKLNKRNIPNENYSCTGTFRVDKRKEYRNSPMERFDENEFLVVNFRNQTMTFQGYTRPTKSSEGTIYTDSSKNLPNTLYFQHQDKTLRVSILDYEKGNTELIPGMVLPLVIEDHLYNCVKQ